MNDVTHLNPELLPSTLDRLSEWGEVFKDQLDTQATFLDATEEAMLVEMRIHYSGDFDPRFIRDMFDAVLQRVISQQPEVYDLDIHAPYSPPKIARQEIPEERREVVQQVVERLAGSMLDRYEAYLSGHWHSAPVTLNAVERYNEVVRQRVMAYHDNLVALLQSASSRGWSVDELRARIDAHQAAWHGQSPLRAVSSVQERKALDTLAKTYRPDWMKLLKEPDELLIQQRQQAKEEAHQLAQRLLGDVLSLRAHARRSAQEYLREHLAREMEPDRIFVKRRLKDDESAAPEKLTLTELVMQGPIGGDLVYVLIEVSGPVQHYRMPTVDQVSQLLMAVDAPASYVHALTRYHENDEVRRALSDVYDTRLQHSALVARSAAHLGAQSYDRISALWANETSDIRVCAIAPVDTSVCSDMLLFYRENEVGVLEDIVLYAPERPGDQEWVEFPTLAQLSAEIGSWLGSQAGRQYVAHQLPRDKRKSAQEYFVSVAERHTEWRLSRDFRGSVTGYRACIEQGVLARLKDWQVEVEHSTSPRWYGLLGIEERRVLCSVALRANIAKQAFLAELKSFEVFKDFAKRTISEKIKDYLQENGITDYVDPESILINYIPALGEGTSHVTNLLNLVCYGYDDNSGIDDPKRGVHSSVGQNLSSLRSAPLANYARRAYIGEKYINETRKTFLDKSTEQYRTRQSLFGQALVGAMDRDLRITVGSQQINRDVYARLTTLVSELGRTLSADRVESGSETVARQDGVFRFSINDYPVLGVYVFRYFDQEQVHDWLYTPGAPDGVLLRQYELLDQAAAGVLYDYLLTRVALIAQEALGQWLIELAAGRKHRDALRDFRQVITVAGEFDVYIEHALTDVDDATQSRVEVIKAQVFKGVAYGLPLFMVIPPFAILLGSYYFVAPLREAIIAHTKGDTAKALSHWLETSLGVLGLVFTVPGLATQAIRHLDSGLRKLVFSLRTPAPRATSLARSVNFRTGWAVERPGNLQEVTEAGIWKGTFKREASSESPGAEYFVRNRGKYFKVVHDQSHNTLRVVKANRPHSYHREPIVRAADGRWVHNNVGLRGGNSTQDLGRITDLRQISGRNGAPVPERGAFQGEAVVARFDTNAANNYLYSLNAQTCVVLSLYNPATRAGAVIHFDHNIRSLIERSVRDVLARLGGVDVARPIRTVMAGGDWLSGADIGGPVGSVLRSKGLRPSWEYWSYSSCLGNTYGMTLNLSTGVTSVYKTSRNLVESLYDPILRGASAGTTALAARARVVLRRVRAEPLREGADGVVLDTLGKPAAAPEVNQQSIQMILLD